MLIAAHCPLRADWEESVVRKPLSLSVCTIGLMAGLSLGAEPVQPVSWHPPRAEVKESVEPPVAGPSLDESASPVPSAVPSPMPLSMPPLMPPLMPAKPADESASLRDAPKPSPVSSVPSPVSSMPTVAPSAKPAKPRIATPVPASALGNRLTAAGRLPIAESRLPTADPVKPRLVTIQPEPLPTPRPGPGTEPSAVIEGPLAVPGDEGVIIHEDGSDLNDRIWIRGEYLLCR